VLGSRLPIHSHDDKLRFGILTAATACSSIWRKYLELESEPLYSHSLKGPVNGSWMALNARSAGERSITLAIFIMSANTLGIIGSQLFQAKDAPLYRVGWTIIVALVSLAVVSAVVANVQYWVLNGRLRRKGVEDEGKLYRL